MSARNVEGRNDRAHIFIDTSLHEKFYGEQDPLYGSGIVDTLRFSSPGGTQGVDLTATVIAGPLADHLHISSDETGEDDLLGIERIELTDNADRFHVNSDQMNFATTVDAGSQPAGQYDGAE